MPGGTASPKLADPGSSLVLASRVPLLIGIESARCSSSACTCKLLLGTRCCAAERSRDSWHARQHCCLQPGLRQQQRSLLERRTIQVRTSPSKLLPGTGGCSCGLWALCITGGQGCFMLLIVAGDSIWSTTGFPGGKLGCLQPCLRCYRSTFWSVQHKAGQL